MPFPPMMMPPIANTFQAPDVDPWGRAKGATELDIPDFGDPEAFQGSSPLELYYYLLQPRRQRVSQQSGPYSYSGPSRHSTVPPENLAAAKQLLEMITKKEQDDITLERKKKADELLRTPRHYGTGEMKMGDRTVTLWPREPKGDYSEAEAAQMFTGGVLPVTSRGVPPGFPAGAPLWATEKTATPARERTIEEKRKEIGGYDEDLMEASGLLEQARNRMEYWKGSGRESSQQSILDQLESRVVQLQEWRTKAQAELDAIESGVPVEDSQRVPMYEMDAAGNLVPVSR